MKKLLLPLSAAVLLSACTGGSGKSEAGVDSTLLSTDLVNNASSLNGADSATLAAMPNIRFADTAHDFGNIREGEVVEHKFAFKNTGKSPLLIAGVQTTCGCTASDYPRSPIAPGAGAEITVRFNSAGKSGHQDKAVVLSTNAAPVVPELHITAEVASKQ